LYLQESHDLSAFQEGLFTLPLVFAAPSWRQLSAGALLIASAPALSCLWAWSCTQPVLVVSSTFSPLSLREQTLCAGSMLAESSHVCSSTGAHRQRRGRKILSNNYRIASPGRGV